MQKICPNIELIYPFCGGALGSVACLFDADCGVI